MTRFPGQPISPSAHHRSALEQPSVLRFLLDHRALTAPVATSMHDGHGRRLHCRTPQAGSWPMYDHDFDRRIERLARRQCGAFSHAQALRAGGSDPMLAFRLRTGQLSRLDTGVYALASYPGSFHRQCWASVLGNPGAGVGGLAAAHLLAFPAFAPGRPEIVAGPDGNARSRDRHRPPIRVPRHDDAGRSSHHHSGPDAVRHRTSSRDRSPRASRRRPVADAPTHGRRSRRTTRVLRRRSSGRSASHASTDSRAAGARLHATCERARAPCRSHRSTLERPSGGGGGGELSVARPRARACRSVPPRRGNPPRIRWTSLARASCRFRSRSMAGRPSGGRGPRVAEVHLLARDGRVLPRSSTRSSGRATRHGVACRLTADHRALTAPVATSMHDGQRVEPMDSSPNGASMTVPPSAASVSPTTASRPSTATASDAPSPSPPAESGM